MEYDVIADRRGVPDDVNGDVIAERVLRRLNSRENTLNDVKLRDAITRKGCTENVTVRYMTSLQDGAVPVMSLMTSSSERGFPDYVTATCCGYPPPSTKARARSTLLIFRSTSRSARWSLVRGRSTVTRYVRPEQVPVSHHTLRSYIRVRILTWLFSEVVMDRSWQGYCIGLSRYIAITNLSIIAVFVEYLRQFLIDLHQIYRHSCVPKTRLRAFFELYSSSGFRARRRRDIFCHVVDRTV